MLIAAAGATLPAPPAAAGAPDAPREDTVHDAGAQPLARLFERLAGLARPQAFAPADAEARSGWITHYGERFNQRSLGCYAYGDYSSDDPTIVAVNPSLYDELPCGTLLELCGPGGCMIAARKDSCPGCRPDGFDLSEAGFQRVCGDADGVCTASVRVLAVCQVRKFGKPEHEARRLEAEELASTGRVPCHPTAQPDPPAE